MAASKTAAKKDGIIKVLAVVPGAAENSSMVFVERQVKSLADIGMSVRTFYLDSRTSPVALFRDCRRLRREIDEFLPDIVHSHYGTVTGLLCALSTTRPLIITYRGSDLNWQPEVSYLRARLGYLASQLAALRSRRIVCVSNSLLRRLWWKRGRAMVIPSGVDLELFTPRSQPEARRVLGWDPRTLVVLFNLHGRPVLKGLDLVEASIEIASRKVGPIQLEVLDGYIAPEQVPLRINAADCVILASKNEGSPNIVKEALACNVPVVSVDVGDVQERLRYVEPSRVVKRDKYEIARALADILPLRARSNGREAVRSISLENVAKCIASMYDEVSRDQRIVGPVIATQS